MRNSTGARRALALLTAAVALTAGALVSSTAASAAPPPVSVMAALGDSITQGTMTCSGTLSCPANSWSTGTNTTVNSHAARIRAAGSPALAAYNDAVVGAASASLPAQASAAVAQGAQYVTVLIGANDACTKTVTAMTPTATFEANVRTALTALGTNGRQIFVSSIPNLKLMYELNKTSFSARFTWGVLQTCQSLLANPSSTKPADVQRRDAVQARVNEYNQALQRACAATAGCLFDNYAVANLVFTRADISTRDYFHPSVAGQAKLAQTTWTALGW